MSNLTKYYADRIKSVLRSGESNGITKAELMKKLSITDEKLMDTILKDVAKEANIMSRNGLYFLKDEMPIEVRDHLRKHFMIGEDIEVR